jgi:hypothetical protein
MGNIHFHVANHFEVEVLMEGSDGGPTAEKQQLISTQAELDHFFDGAPPSGELDFSHDFIFAISLGQRPTGAYAVEITDISQATIGIMAGVVTVSYREVAPDGPATQQLSNPYIIVRAKGLQYASGIHFRKASSGLETLNVASLEFDAPELTAATSGSKFIVIALTGTSTGCQILPEHAMYLAIYSQVYGPASFSACQDYIVNSCTAHVANP